MAEFFCIPTDIGAAKIANKIALRQPIELTAMSVGDGNGTTPIPDKTRRTLVNERRRALLNTLFEDPDNPGAFIAELVLPPDVGGWYITELGLHDIDGDLCYIANCPPTYKPLLTEGATRTQTVRMQIVVTDGLTVTLKVDPTIVLATRKYVDESISAELDKRDAKQSAYVATTGPLAALSGLQNIDGQPITAGARVLVKDQVAAKDNGIYIAAVGAWIRATDFDSGLDVTPGITIPVEQGAVNYGSVWHLTTQGAIIIGATPLSFKRVGAGYFAPLNSPDFVGQVLVDTAAPGTNNRQAANTGWVNTAIAAALASLIAAAPGQLDTLNELAAALGNDANFSATMTAELAKKANLSGAAFTGIASGLTPAQFDASTKFATMEALQRALGNLSGSAGFSASGNLTAAMAGKIITVGMLAAGQALTLPALNGLPEGAQFVMQNLGGYAFNVQRTGTDFITASGSAITVVSIGPGEDATFIKTNGGWVFSGRAAIGRGYNFSANFGANGFQRLPSGLIIQWLDYANSTAVAGGVYGVSWPIAFPNAFINAQICNVNSGNGLFVWNNAFYSLGGINLQVNSGGSVRCNVFAIGW